ncbi:putative chitinase [Paraburkholderia sp. MM5496-R1]
MIISPPFLPASGLTASDESKPDPMMDLVDPFEIGHHGVWPVTFDRRFHCGIHLNPGTQGAGQAEPVRAIADGDVVAYRVCKNRISDGTVDPKTGLPVPNSNAGFVLLRHKTDTGDGRTITYYSLYMHLLDMTSQEDIVPQPNDPPETGSANALPKWLLDTAGGKDGVVQAGGTKKVYRKDLLGYVGQHQGVAHLHFEIFMADTDFTDWFDKVQIGVKNPAQPTTGDYWGHSYFIISGPQEFPPQPAGMDEKWFPKLPGGPLDEHDTLYVEAWFNKGRRYTRAWIDKGGSGKVTLLTPGPVADPYDNAQKQYEYDLYERAMALYPACPSDGYEMLRFGRILSQQGSTVIPPATWIAVPFDENGTLGYVNIAPDAIRKLSDADFPFFTGWQKVDGDNTPFNDAGRCDYATLCGLTGIQDSLPSAQPLEADPNNNNEVNLLLASYVQNTDGVDEKLRGMVFKARSEWDASNNEERYKDLNDPDGFFGKQKDTNPDGYTKFTDFLSKFQFLDKTPLAGQELWFFHPLAFIRHFRKCGWIGVQESKQLMPAHAWFSSVGALRQPLANTLSSDQVAERVSSHLSDLNKTIRKYSLNLSPERLAIFLAQTFIETDRWKTFIEYGRGAANPHIPMAQYYGAFYGRGIMQLTWANGYEAYGKFSAKPNNPGSYIDPRITPASLHYWEDPTKKVHGQIVVVGVPKLWAPRYDPDVVGADSFAACDSGGFFWIWKHHDGTRNISRVADLGISGATIDKVNKLVNGGPFGYFERFAFTWYTQNIFTDWIPAAAKINVATPRQATVFVDLSRPS